MTKLTEEMVIARTRASDLTNIKKLNCWGSNLSDVSLIRRMYNVEVLSLSVNDIPGLVDFQNCHNLQELYIRKNNISDLEEICYLRDLPKLRSLWLADNPCALVEGYRLSVIRMLPQLNKLDNIVIQDEEKQMAQEHGRELFHPEEKAENHQREQDLRQTPPYLPHQASLPELRRGSHGSTENLTHPPGHLTRSESDYSVEQMNRMRIKEEDNEYYDPDWRNANYVRDDSDARPQNYGKANSLFGCGTEYPSEHVATPHGSAYQPIDYLPQGANVHSHSHPQQQHPSSNNFPCTSADLEPPCYAQEPVPVTNDTPEPRYSGKQYYLDGSSNRSGESGDDLRHIMPQQFEHAYQPMQQHMDSTAVATPTSSGRSHSVEKTTYARPYPPRPKNRNSNILSAVLCLVKELDYPSLEVVEMAVKCRMDELDE